jgi:uncharacterized membrane protein
MGGPLDAGGPSGSIGRPRPRGIRALVSFLAAAVLASSLPPASALAEARRLATSTAPTPCVSAPAGPPSGPAPGLATMTESSDVATVTGLSDDGRIAVGTYPNLNFGYGLAFLWTQARGEIHFAEDAGYTFSSANAISADGKRIVGVTGRIDLVRRAFVWTRRGGFVFLGDGSESLGVPVGLSGDGRTIVGSGPGGTGASRWSAEDGLVVLPPPREDAACGALDVSDDGGAIVGTCNVGFDDADAEHRRIAVRWDVGRGTTVLAESEVLTPTSPFVPCRAQAVSGDGRVAVGACRGRAFRWEAGKAVALAAHDPSESGSEALVISRDGRVIAGTVLGAAPARAPQAAVWLAGGRRVRTLAEILADAGLSTALAPWIRLSSITAMSEDGRVLAGDGVRSSTAGPRFATFRASLPAPPCDRGSSRPGRLLRGLPQSATDG